MKISIGVFDSTPPKFALRLWAIDRVSHWFYTVCVIAGINLHTAAGEPPDFYSKSTASAMVESIRSSTKYTDATKSILIAKLRFDFDNRALSRASGDKAALVSLTESIRREWTGEAVDQSALLFAIAARHLLALRNPNSDLENRAIRFASDSLNLTTATSPLVSQEILTLLNHPVRNGSNSNASLAHLVDRESMLEKSLQVLQRIEGYVSIPLNELTKPYTDRLFLDEPDPPSLSAEACAVLRENYQLFHQHAYQRQQLVDTNRGPSRLETTKRELARFVARQFTTNASDLQIVRRVLARNISDPTLKDRLIQVLYQGQNPFLELSEDSATGPASPSLEVLTKKSRAGNSSNIATGDSRNNLVPSSPAVGSLPPTDISPRSIPYLPLGAVFGAGLALWWFISRSRGG